MKRIAFLLTLLFLGILTYPQQGIKSHTLKKGETLYSISRLYNVSVSDLQKINNIDDPSAIPIGKMILIPNIHTVEKGETLSAIAEKYDISLSEIYKLNGLDSNSVIYPGDFIMLPEIVETEHSGEIDITEKVSMDKTSYEKSTEKDINLFWPHSGLREDFDGKFKGVYINGDKGDDFVSVSSGVVIFCEYQRGYGLVIIIKSADNYFYWYRGAEKAYVQLYQKIEPGMKLGQIWEDPRDNKAKLLFSVSKSNNYLDPAEAPRK